MSRAADAPTEAAPPLHARAASTRHLIALLMGGALVSKLLGFARELMMAHVLGASMIADGFRGAVTAILLPLIFLQNESVPAIMIPIQRDAHRNGDAPHRLAALTIALALTALVLMAAVEAGGRWWVDAVVGGFVPEGRALTLEFVRVMATGMPASVIVNCLSAGEIALGRSSLTNLRASLLNLCTMLGLALLLVTGRVDLLAWSFTLAFNGLAGWGLWSMWRRGDLRFTGLTAAAVMAAGAEFLRRLRPLIGLPFAEQANMWIERAVASRLMTGAVASLDYARTLTESALLLISQPVGLGVLSSHSPNDERARIEAIACPVLAVALPAAAFVAVFAPDIVWLVFYRGAFTETGVALTSQALRGIAVGLWASTLGWILLRTLNSAGRNARAALILMTAYAANILVNVATSGIQEATGMGPLIIGLGETTRSFVLLAGAVLALECRRRIVFLILVALGPAIMMALIGWHFHEHLAGALHRVLAGGLLCLLGMALEVGMLMPATCHAGIRLVRSRIIATTRTT